MAMPAQPTEWTVEMVRALPDDGNRYEVIDGELFVTPAPSVPHQRAVLQLALLVAPYVRAQRVGEVIVAPADAVVYCTGYKVTFPFFDPQFVSAPDNELPLFLRCFHLEHRGLMFAGLAQPLGAIMPLVEAQGRLFASFLRGDYELPEASEMRRRTAREREYVRRRFVASRRHTMQVDFDRYLEDLQREMRAGHHRSGRKQPASARG